MCRWVLVQGGAGCGVRAKISSFEELIFGEIERTLNGPIPSFFPLSAPPDSVLFRLSLLNAPDAFLHIPPG